MELKTKSEKRETLPAGGPWESYVEGVGFDMGCRDAAIEVSTADEQRELLLGEGHKAAAYVNHEVFAAVSTGLPVGAPAGASEVWPGTQRGKSFDHVSCCL
jgi:hypothetical protein